MSVNQPVEAWQVNAFADQAASGSPTGVVFNADSLDPDTMLAIARRLNVSHTAFLSESRRADCVFAIRFVTPNGELKNCAHATIAAHYLRATKFGVASGQPTRQETSAGTQEVWTTETDEGLLVSFKQNEIVQKSVGVEIIRRLTDALGCTTASVHPDYPVRLVSPGSFRFMVPMRSSDDVFALRPDFVKIDHLCREMQSIGCFVFYVNGIDQPGEAQAVVEDSIDADIGSRRRGQTSVHRKPATRAHGRMFAPTIGVDEDAVNGNSSGCLGAYLMDLPDGRRWGSQLRLQVLQGHQSGHASSVNVEAHRAGNRIETFVGGGARLVGPMQLTPFGASP